MLLFATALIEKIIKYVIFLFIKPNPTHLFKDIYLYYR